MPSNYRLAFRPGVSISFFTRSCPFFSLFYDIPSKPTHAIGWICCSGLMTWFLFPHPYLSNASLLILAVLAIILPPRPSAHYIFAMAHANRYDNLSFVFSCTSLRPTAGPWLLPSDIARPCFRFNDSLDRARHLNFASLTGNSFHEWWKPNMLSF
jgi:hypothetical protein